MSSSRPNVRNRFVLIGDVALIIVSVLGSFALRLDVSQLPFYFPAAMIMCAAALLVKMPVYFLFGLYRRLWIYASTNELRLITVAVTTASVLTSGLMLVLISAGFIQPGMPRSALGIDWLLSLVLIGGSRFALRILAEQSAAPRIGKAKRALIIGAGDAGALVARELQKSSQLNLIPIGFLDDDPAKQHHEIYGVSVIGTVDKLADVLDNQQVDEVIIAIPSAPGNIIRLVNDACRQKGISSRTMPGIYELIGGKVSVNRLREVDITDLLRREPTKIDNRLIGTILSGKRVLVTGAGGSIGREICRQAARWPPAEMIVLDGAQRSGRAYSVVRFGNVLGSRGSVVPLFKNQIARGGPITVTHPEMYRYFMTIPEAVHLVLQAAAMGMGGEVFMLNMGQQVRILDLAEDLIRLSGLEPNRDIEITFSGIRPGEKLREDLWEDGMQFRPTQHSEIYRAAEEEKVDGNQLTHVIERLTYFANQSETENLIRLLDESIPSASIRSTPPPDMTSVV